MTQEIWLTLIGGGTVSFALTFLITWGSLKTSTHELERRIDIAEKQSERQLELIHSLRDVYVSYQHFNEIMTSVRESQRELKSDLAKILGLLSVHP